MNARLSLEVEILQPVLVASARELQELVPSQLRWVHVLLAVEGADVVTLSTEASLYDLVDLARKSQPNGTGVRVWYQGRSEEFVI